MWDKLQMNMNGPRRSKPSSGSKRGQLRGQPTLASARQDRATARPRRRVREIVATSALFSKLVEPRGALALGGGETVRKSEAAGAPPFAFDIVSGALRDEGDDAAAAAAAAAAAPPQQRVYTLVPDTKDEQLMWVALLSRR